MLKKLYIVKIEVLATSLKKALTTKGKVYSIEIVEDRFQPVDNSKPIKKIISFIKR